MTNFRPPPLRQSNPRAHNGAPPVASAEESNIMRFDQAHTNPSKLPAVLLRLYACDASENSRKASENALKVTQPSLLGVLSRELTGVGDTEEYDPNFLDFKEDKEGGPSKPLAVPVVQRVSSKCLSVYYSQTSGQDSDASPHIPKGWFFVTRPPKEYKLVINIESLGLLHNVKNNEGPNKRGVYGNLKGSLAAVAVVRADDRIISATLMEGDKDSSFAWSVGLRWKAGGGRVDVRFYCAMDAPIAVEGTERLRVGYGRWVKLGWEIEGSAVNVGLYNMRGGCREDGKKEESGRKAKRRREKEGVGASKNEVENAQPTAAGNSREVKRRRSVRFQRPIASGSGDAPFSPPMSSPISFRTRRPMR